MPKEGLRSGDMVVELPGMVRSSASVTGALVGAWLLWRVYKHGPAACGGLVGGAVASYLVAYVLARLLYRIGMGETVVTKVGRASLPSTIRAGLAGGMTGAVVILLIALMLPGGRDQIRWLLPIALTCGTVIGTFFACMGSLL